MPTYGNQGNCSSEVIVVSIILNSKINSNMANYSALVTVVGSCYAFRIKCMCNGTFGTSHVFTILSNLQNMKIMKSVKCAVILNSVY